MDHSSKSNQQHHLGINKIGKTIRKSPLHQPNHQKLPPPAANQPPAPQPHVYNISKSDFRSVVQQLTGSPSRDSTRYPTAPARPPQPKNPSSRLMKIRPPPLTPIPRPPPIPFQNHPSIPNPNPNFNPNQTFFPRANGNVAWADSPVSAYMRYLESSLQTPPISHPQSSNSQFLTLPPGSHFPYPSPNALSLPLPSPNSQFPLQSPSSFLNLLTPKSPYPLLSPRFQHSAPSPLNFSFSPLPQNGLLGPGPGSLPPPSPTLLFPPSPSGFLPLLSPRWREM